MAEGFGEGLLILLGLGVAGEGLINDGEFLCDVFLYVEGVLLSTDAKRLADCLIDLLQEVLLPTTARLHLCFHLLRLSLILQVQLFSLTVDLNPH